MLEIKAVTYNDLAPVMPISKTMPPEGGTIGRGPDNVLSLPDPMRLISRQHLHVMPDGSGGYRIVNISSSNMVYVNSVELRPGQNCVLSAGDRIYIGGYLLQVQVGESLQDNSADAYSAQSENNTDTLWASIQASVISESTDDFITDLLGSATPSFQDQAAPAVPTNDPLENFLHPSAHDEGDPMQALQTSSIELRDLTGKGDILINHSDDGIDHAKDLLQDTSSLPTNMLSNNTVDPLAFFDNDRDHPFQELGLTIPKAPVDVLTIDQDGVGLAQIFTVPQKASIQQIAEISSVSDDYNSLDQTDTQEVFPITASHRSASPSKALSETTAKNSIDDSLQQFPDKQLFRDVPDSLNDPLVNLLGMTPTEHANDVSSIQAQLPPGSNQLPAADNTSIQPATSLSDSTDLARSQPIQKDVELYQALLKGLGLKEIPDRYGLDPHFMFLLGKLLRCSAQGTVDLMAGRAVIKREVRANVTLIAPERNNPLKFSPDGEVAIMYLLGRTYPGFMQPAEAMENAYLDLRAHQMGLVSGMRSALGYVLDKFDPKVIEDTTKSRTILGLSIARKARLWDAYQSYFQTTRNEAQDRFQEFFGEAFLKAYDEAIASLNAKHAVKSEGDE